jgi:transposase
VEIARGAGECGGSVDLYRLAGLSNVGGKSKKLALTACVRKMLVTLNAMVRANQPWQISDLSIPITT